MKRLLILFLFFSLSFLVNAQDSPRLKISLLTCAAGEELYSSFGHTALRIYDSATHRDVVYNYGVFNFDDENFYWKFTRGMLDFMVVKEDMNEFMQEYVYTQRSVKEQDLNLNNDEKKLVKNFLENNILPQNKYYKYDFLYDNCATRIRDILFDKISSVSLTKSIVQQGTSFRELIYFYLDRSGQPWSKLGIDILLGSPIDKKLDNNTAMFLPDFLSEGIGEATIHGKPYVVAERQLIAANADVQPQGKYIPLIVFITVCAFVLLLYFLFRKNIFLTHLLDCIFLYITGLMGILLLFMWFFTDHLECAKNLNLLWALPTNFIAAFFVWKKRDWLRNYFLMATIITFLLIVCWWFLPQHFNIALLPFCILMLFVYMRLAKK